MGAIVRAASGGKAEAEDKVHIPLTELYFSFNAPLVPCIVRRTGSGQRDWAKVGKEVTLVSRSCAKGGDQVAETRKRRGVLCETANSWHTAL